MIIWRFAHWLSCRPLAMLAGGTLLGLITLVTGPTCAAESTVGIALSDSPVIDLSLGDMVATS